jgi:hypothetical protein
MVDLAAFFAAVERPFCPMLPNRGAGLSSSYRRTTNGTISSKLSHLYSRTYHKHRCHAFQKALEHDFDSILEMDADFSHDPRYLPHLVDSLQDADLVIGSRYVEGGGTENWSRVREAISRGGNWVARVGLGVHTADATGGFRAFRRSTLEQLSFSDLSLRGYGFQIEVVYQVESRGMRIKEIPIVFVERRAGRSKMSWGIVAEAIIHIMRRRLRMVRGHAGPTATAVPRKILEKERT